jgi:hypothetical protein
MPLEVDFSPPSITYASTRAHKFDRAQVSANRSGIGFSTAHSLKLGKPGHRARRWDWSASTMTTTPSSVANAFKTCRPLGVNCHNCIAPSEESHLAMTHAYRPLRAAVRPGAYRAARGCRRRNTRLITFPYPVLTGTKTIESLPIALERSQLAVPASGSVSRRIHLDVLPRSNELPLTIPVKIMSEPNAAASAMAAYTSRHTLRVLGHRSRAARTTLLCLHSHLATNTDGSDFPDPSICSVSDLPY